MAYIEAHQSVLSHRKTLRLSRLLGMDRFAVVGRLVALWTWALDNAPDGLIAASDAELLADVMGYGGEAETLCGALVSSGFLDACDEGLAIHDWYSYAGRLIDQRKANAERQARFRERSAGRVARDVASASGHVELVRNADVTVTSPSRNGATVPYPTVPNRNDNSTAEGDYVGGVPVAAHGETVVAAGAAPDDLSRSTGHVYAEDSEPMRLARALAQGIRGHKPDAKLPRSLQGWAREFDLMLRVDHRPREKIEAVMAFAMASSFWRGVILSAGKLKQKFDTLDIQRQEDRGASHGRYSRQARGSAPRPGSPEYYARAAAG